jgi:hypothetical protein
MAWPQNIISMREYVHEQVIKNYDRIMTPWIFQQAQLKNTKLNIEATLTSTDLWSPNQP